MIPILTINRYDLKKLVWQIMKQKMNKMNILCFIKNIHLIQKRKNCMKLFENNNTITDFSISVNNFSCISNDISGTHYEINHRYINYEILYSHLPLYYDNLDKLNDGIYVWMLLTCDDELPKMYIIQCQNINELGTKHSNIIHRLHTFCNKKKIVLHYAGEFKKCNDIIQMNFSSGSYMREVFENNDRTNLISIKECNYRLNYMNDLLKFLNIEKYKKMKIMFMKKDNETFITKDNVPLKKEHLDLYKECNCEILIFYSETECKQYLENKKQWERYYHKINLYEINKHKYDFLKPPEKPVFKFDGIQF